MLTGKPQMFKVLGGCAAMNPGADSKNITLRNTHQFQYQPHSIPLTLSLLKIIINSNIELINKLNDSNINSMEREIDSSYEIHLAN